MKNRLGTGKLFAFLLTLVLVCTYVIQSTPAASFEEEGLRSEPVSAQQEFWYDSIPEMLAAGDYEEGVVVAGIDMSKANHPKDSGSALESEKLREGTEDLISVDPDGTMTEEAFFSWLQEHKGTLSGQDDGICITSIRSSDMTTAQILELLACDDSIVFAEPNYITCMSSEEDDAEISGTVDADDAFLTDSGDDDFLTDSGDDDFLTDSGDDDFLTDSAEDAFLTDSADQDIPGITGEARDASSLQWSSSEDASLHAAYKIGDVSMKVPGWPDGSNMDTEIIVAVMDMPVDFTNPDLADRAYTFSPELKASLECADHGYNATWDSQTGTNELEYLPGADHGTHVAGIIGASWDGRGINGVGSDVKLISVQNCHDMYTSLIDTLKGYDFLKRAVESGVDIRIVNNSWAVPQTSRAVDAAVTELGKYGVLSVFAAGNYSEDLNIATSSSSLLAENPYAVVVASTSPSGEPADSTSYGKGVVTLGAPGAGILSCLQTQDAQYIPVLTEQNKIYENFESGDAGLAAVRVCQIGYTTHTDEYGNVWMDPDPEKEIIGTEGIVVSDEMGFEGQNVLKVRFDKSPDNVNEDHVALRVDFGNVKEKDIHPGDLFGFAYGGKAELEPSGMVDTESGSKPSSGGTKKSRRNCMDTFEYTLEEGINPENLSFTFDIEINGAEEVYLDAFGIGSEEAKLPYGIKSGTSMASPAVAGAAAVIASRHFEELPAGEAASAEKLANLVRSSVRPLASLKDLTSTGGIIDLTVETEVFEPGPDITDISAGGREVMLTGTGFGSDAGTVTVRKYVIGASSEIGNAITSWTDNAVSLSLAENFEGIIEAELTASNGKSDTIVKYISKSSNVFENDHHFGSDTGAPLVFDEPDLPDGDPGILGDLETAGILTAGDGRLYYMPESARVEENPVYRTLYCYDPDEDSWTVCPAYPSWIRNASGAWLDGKLYVKGTAADPYDTERYEQDFVSVYSYTPGAGSWEKCSETGLASELTLFTAGSVLMLAGTTPEEDEASEGFVWPSVRYYDPSAGAGEPLGTYPVSDPNPKAAYAGGRIYLFAYTYWNRLYVLDENMSASEEDAIELPEFYRGGAERLAKEDFILGESNFSMVSCDDKLILAGPAAEDGSSDTYILESGERSFKPYSRRISDAGVLMANAAVLDGRLYVIGGSVYEPFQRIFRSTQVNGSEPEAWPFTDVKVEPGNWIYDAAKYVYDRGIMTGMGGTTCFNPAGILSRGQFVTILYRMAGEEASYKQIFPDVKESDWFGIPVSWANQTGVVTGYESGYFGPADDITREQLATMLYRYAGYKKLDTSEKADFSKYPDADKVSDWAYEAMQWAVGTGIIQGQDGGKTLDPQGKAGRAECATMIMRFMEKYMN